MRENRKLKIVSNNKVRANRENAKKSTGPRTVSGKEKVSGNAYEPVNKGRLGSTQEWKIDKLGRKYY